MSHQLLRWFTWSHLRDSGLQDVSRRFGVIAGELDALLPDSAEKTDSLRKLLEAKDAAVRAALDLPTTASCTRPEMTVTGPFRYCDDPACPAHAARPGDARP